MSGVIADCSNSSSLWNVDSSRQLRQGTTPNSSASSACGNPDIKSRVRTPGVPYVQKERHAYCQGFRADVQLNVYIRRGTMRQCDSASPASPRGHTTHGAPPNLRATTLPTVRGWPGKGTEKNAGCTRPRAIGAYRGQAALSSERTRTLGRSHGGSGYLDACYACGNAKPGRRLWIGEGTRVGLKG